MSSSLDQICARLDALDGSAFDMWNADSHGAEDLADLMDQVNELPNPRHAIPALFRFLERLHLADLGSPGPVVHALEAIGHYDAELTESMLRQPTPLTVWMVNRMLNAESDSKRRQRHLSLLRHAARHRGASEETVAAALSFLRFQGDAA